MADEARGAQKLIRCVEEHGAINREGELDVAQVAGAVHVVEPARATEVVLAGGSQGRVVKAAKVGIEQAVERVGIGNPFAADTGNLLARVRGEMHRREAAGGRETRVQTANVYHFCNGRNATWNKSTRDKTTCMEFQLEHSWSYYGNMSFSTRPRCTPCIPDSDTSGRYGRYDR